MESSFCCTSSTSGESPPLLCARCFVWLGTPSVLLAQRERGFRRRALLPSNDGSAMSPPSRPFQHLDGILASGSYCDPVWCQPEDGTAARPGINCCTEAYCSAACRDADRPVHAFACRYRSTSKVQVLARKTGNDALLLTATLLFTAVGEGRDAAWVLAQCDDRCSLAAEAAAAEEEEAASEEEDEARASLVDDAWMLLQEDVLRDESGRARLTDPTLLSRALFERVYAAIERRALPLQVASPLVRFCEEFSRLPASDPKHAPALRTLMKVVRTRWPTSAAGDRRGATAAGGVESASDQLDALLASEAYEASREEEGEGADDAGAVGRSGGIGAEEAGPGRLVRAQRRACLLAQCAPRLFPPVLLVAYSPSAGRIGHSCVPSVQLQLHATHGQQEGEGKRESGGSDEEVPLGPRTSLVRIRDPLYDGEPPSIAWVDVAQSRLEERAAALRRRLGRLYQECACERCRFERAPASQRAQELLQASRATILARDAIEDGRLEQGASMLRSRLAHAPTDGDAWMLLGTCLLNLDKWGAAHAAWRDGVQRAPEHELLAKQHAKDAAYAAACHATSAASPGTARGPASSAKGDVPCEMHHLGGGGAVARMITTCAPAFSREECAMLIREAEGHAERSGGWTTARHHAVPTTDVPLHLVPPLLSWFNTALANTLAPMLAAQFGGLVKSASAVRVHDAFLVRYTAGRQQHLPLHTDESQISLTIVLNDGFRGGGTYFADLRRAVSPSVGHVIAFEGHALHGGEPIVQGTRYIIAAFLHVVDVQEADDDDEEERGGERGDKRDDAEAASACPAGSAVRGRKRTHGTIAEGELAEDSGADGAPSYRGAPEGSTANLSTSTWASTSGGGSFAFDF